MKSDLAVGFLDVVRSGVAAAVAVMSTERMLDDKYEGMPCFLMQCATQSFKFCPSVSCTWMGFALLPS